MSDDNFPAFPHEAHLWQRCPRCNKDLPPTSGMSMRDYFAAAALVGMLAKPNSDYEFSGAAYDAYQFADAMLRQRAKPTNQSEAQVSDEATA